MIDLHNWRESKWRRAKSLIRKFSAPTKVRGFGKIIVVSYLNLNILLFNVILNITIVRNEIYISPH